MSYFQKNMSVIGARWPTVAGVLDAASADTELEWFSRGEEKTLIISGIQITSAYDREAEAAVQATLVPSESDRATVYGFALGDLPRMLLTRKTLSILRVVVMNPEVAAICCSAADMTDWLTDSRVTLHLAWEETDVSYPFAAAPASLQLAANRAAPLRDNVVLELARPFQERHFRNMDALLDAQLKKNISYIQKDGDVAALFGSAVHRIGVVVAGGPTASEQFDMIRERRDELLIVVVSTALKSLLAAEVIPDVVVVIDPKVEMSAHFEEIPDEPLNRVPLVYLPTVHTGVLDRWPGPRLVTYISRSRFERLAEEIPRGILFCAGSVTHTAVDLAIRMGIAELMLVGADFGFPGQKRHVEGAVDNEPIGQGEGAAHPFVVNGFGERIPSRTDMVGFLRDLERYIAQHPEVTFWNTGKAGAEIVGAAWLDE